MLQVFIVWSTVCTVIVSATWLEMPSQLTLSNDLLTGNIQVDKKFSGRIVSLESSLNTQMNYYKQLMREEKTWESLFTEFKTTYNKSYQSTDHESKSKMLFHKRLSMVLENNLKAIYQKSTYVLALNSFSDLPLEQIMEQPAGNWPPTAGLYHSLANDSTYVNSWVFDKYRQHHQVGPIQNQGNCGACAYFAAAATIESHWALSGHKLEPLSVQQLNDCARDEKHGNRGCQHGGGTFVPTFNYIKTHGLTSWHNYPYVSKDGNCDHNKEKHPVAHIKNWHSVLPHGNENALKSAVEHHGPVAVAIHFNDALAHYRAGIYDGNCAGGRNHAILLVGFGYDAPSIHNYWILKNQWGEHYGEHGYFRIRRDHGNLCDIAGDAVYVE